MSDDMNEKSNLISTKELSELWRKSNFKPAPEAPNLSYKDGWQEITKNLSPQEIELLYDID